MLQIKADCHVLVQKNSTLNAQFKIGINVALISLQTLQNPHHTLKLQINDMLHLSLS